MIKTWRLDLAHATLVVASQNERMAEIVYFGARLPDELDLEQLVLAGQLDISGGMLDENRPISICPETGATIQGHPGGQTDFEDRGGDPPVVRF